MFCHVFVYVRVFVCVGFCVECSVITNGFPPLPPPFPSLFHYSLLLPFTLSPTFLSIFCPSLNFLTFPLFLYPSILTTPLPSATPSQVDSITITLPCPAPDPLVPAPACPALRPTKPAKPEKPSVLPRPVSLSPEALDALRIPSPGAGTGLALPHHDCRDDGGTRWCLVSLNWFSFVHNEFAKLFAPLQSVPSRYYLCICFVACFLKVLRGDDD